MHILHPRLCNKSVQNVVSPWLRVFGGVNEAFGRNSQYPCAAHSRLWVVSVMSCNELPGVWTHADTTSQPRPEGAGCGGNIDAAADKTTASVSVCVREWEGECVCVKGFHKAINRHVYTRGSVSAALPWRQSSRQQLCHIHQSFEEFTQRDAVLFSWCRNISRPDEGIVVVFLFSINRKVNEESKGRTRIVFYWSRCLICVWTLRLWCAILGNGRSRTDSNTFINNS